MTFEESKQLVRFLAGLDGRRVTQEAAHAFHQMLGNYTYADAKAAAQTAVRNTTRAQCTVGEILSVLNGQAGAGIPRSRYCTHGVPLGAPCHDCTHPADCPMCMPIPGLSDTPANRRATVASFAAQVARRTRIISDRHDEPEPDPSW